MRRFSYLLVFGVLFMLLQAFTTGSIDKVKFKKYNWTDIGRSARSQNKMIFVLVTGDYCPTSRKMQRVLSDKKVAQFYNKNFVSTNFDAENFVQHYRAGNWGISSVPAVVFLDKNRNVIHKAEGYLDAHGLLREAELALEKKKDKK